MTCELFSSTSFVLPNQDSCDGVGKDHVTVTPEAPTIPNSIDSTLGQMATTETRLMTGECLHVTSDTRLEFISE